MSLHQLVSLAQNFTLFDKQATGAIPADELATVLRACGQNPTEAEIAILVEKASAATPPNHSLGTLLCRHGSQVVINKNGLIEFEEVSVRTAPSSCGRLVLTRGDLLLV